ncbi:glycoside hydrolase family 32 protein [Candidatus Sumerlaeota bacterium]|nr:glycoside hydrolase family 32 protein [Candidatus Sumerlaeota bacterium]
MTVLAGNEIIDQFEIELAPDEPDFWVSLDVGPHVGKKARIEVDQMREDSKGLAAIRQSDEVPDAENLYKEKYRPQFHFSSRRGWNNDPNGLVYYKGEYHLFYQHNPYGWNWGNMHWGHAVSRDLVHWQELPVALYPDELGTMFSGSAVVDSHNTAGFQEGPESPVVCIYTAAGGTNFRSQGQPFTQCIAYSLDRGRSWKKYEKNPALPHIIGRNRDPKVIWHEDSKKWVMALYLDKNDFALFGSNDLKTWKRLCDVAVPGTSECPEFFEIPVDGNKSNTRWVFYGGNGSYLVGRFDGTTFKAELGPHALNYGNCFYASQTFNNIPPDDGRRIQIAWGRVGHPDMPFNQMMDFPVELTLRTTDEGLRLFAQPVREIERLHRKKHTWQNVALKEGDNPLEGIAGDLFHIVAEFKVGDARQFGFTIRGASVTYHVQNQALSCREKTAPLKPTDGKIQLEILVDRTSVEIFANDGRLYMPIGVIPPDDNHKLEVFTLGGETQVRSLEVFELHTAWK